MEYSIPKFLQPFVAEIKDKKVKAFLSLYGTSFDKKKYPEVKCRNCEHLIVTDVSNNRGSGSCYHNKSEFGKSRYRYFSDPICDNYKPRTSSLDLYQGGEEDDAKWEKLYKLYHNRWCSECHSRLWYRKENSLTCKCGKLRFDPIRKEVKQ